MNYAVFRFYSELNDFLPRENRFRDLVREFNYCASVKDMIEALGVPHTEVELIVLNDSAAVDFGHLVRSGDRFGVYPAFRSLKITADMRLRPVLHLVRFVADVHLGRLSAYLRMLGFDTVYRNDYVDSDLARISRSENRILLTCDRGLLKRSEVVHGCFLRETEPREQLVEVIRRFDLLGKVEPLRRCIRCNALLESVSKESIRSQLPPKVVQYYDEFVACPLCKRIYWAGSHYEHMRTFLGRIFELAQARV